MITKTKPKGWMLRLLSALFLTIAFTACSSTEDSIEDPTKPQTPINDDDWQVVHATGGTITKDSLSIIFPSGTFSKDAKVAITEVKKGESFGEYEVTPFYQVMLPAKLDKAITVKIKCKAKSDEIRCVAKSSGFRKSVIEDVESSTSLEATFSNGEYQVTLPATKNNEDDESSTITIGLIKDIEESSDGRTRSFGDIQGKVDNIEWYYNIGTWEYYKMSASDRKKVNDLKPKLNEYIEAALKQIHKLDFKIEGNRRIPFVFINDVQKPNAYGYFVQNKRYDEWSNIELNRVKLFSGIDETSIKQTVIHELLHYYEASYDPRSPSDKNWGGEEAVISEAASVWIEQFMNNKKLNTSFVMGYISNFIKGLEVPDSIYPNEFNSYLDPLKWRSKYLENLGWHGYGMSVVLYYLTSPTSGMSGFDFDYNSIAEIFKLWKSDKRFAGKSFTTFRRWLGDHNCSSFVDTDLYDDFLIELLDGKVIQHKNLNPADCIDENKNNKPIQLNSDTKKEVPGKCFNLGCSIDKIAIGKYKNTEGVKSFKGKEIVIKQTSPDVRTRVFVQSQSQKFELIKGKTIKGDSLVIDGDEFDKMMGGEQKYFLFPVTTNHSGQTKSYAFTIEIRDKKQDTPVAKGMISKMYMLATMAGKTDGGSSTYFGFGFSTESELHAPPAITTKKDGSTLHVESSQEFTHAIQWGHQTEKQSVSFDILNFTGDLKNVTITNFKIYSKTVASVSPPPDEWIIMGDDEEGEIVLNNIVNPSVKEMDDGTIRLYFKNGTWKVTAEYGLLEVISGYCIKSGSSSSRTYSYDDSQVAEIEMELYFNK